MASERDRKATPFEVPEQMRTFADKSVDQARKAFDAFMNATREAVAAAEAGGDSLRADADEMRAKALELAERNVDSAFALAQKLVQARTVEEIAEIHAAYLRQQFESMADSAVLMGEDFMKSASTTARTLGEQAIKAMSEAARSAEEMLRRTRS